jgi:CBS domain-containing protein
MKLQDLCILDVACCARTTTIATAARTMRQQHVGDLIVVDDTDGTPEPVGIVTDRDIVTEVIGRGLDPDKTSVADVMTRQLVIASASEDMDTAIERMRTHGVRRLPVVDANGGVLGILTLDDIYRQQAEQAAALVTIVNKEQSRENRGRR